MVDYCPNCNQNVEGKKNFHGVAFILLFIFVWLPGVWIGFWLSVGSALIKSPIIPILFLVWLSLPIIYTLKHIFLKTPRCPICNTKIKKIQR